VTSNLRKVLMRLTHIFLLAAALCCAHPGYSLSRPFSGNASYYGKRLQGHRMANGRRYNRRDLTAATRRLPLGSHARVTSLRTHRSVKVTVTDRGPFKKHRVIDLSEAAARRLGMMHRGIDRVRVVPMK
jgi:rare lipoprotein A